MENTSNENIAAALKLLEEAAKQKKDELKAAMTDKYTHLRGMFMDEDGGLRKSLAATKEQVVQAALDAKEAALTKTRELARTVDTNVHENPWAHIAGAAVVGVLLGYILGGRKRD